MNLAVRLLGFVLGVVLAGASVVSAEDATTQWREPDRLVDAFVELALRSGGSARVKAVQKWTTPIRYAIVHRVGEEDLHTRLVQTHLAHLTRITGLDIEAAATEAEANYLVVLTREDWLEADTGKYLGTTLDRGREAYFRDRICLASFRVGHKGGIVRAVAIIPVDRARGKGDLLGCVVEELTHMMGISNDTEQTLPTIFHHRTVRSFLTGLDYILLKMLYDYRIRPGMKEPELRPVLEQIAYGLRRAHFVEVADRIVIEGGLAEFCP